MSQILIGNRSKAFVVLGLTVVGLALWKWDQIKTTTSHQPPVELQNAALAAAVSDANEVAPLEPQLKASEDSANSWEQCYESPPKATDLQDLLEATVPEEARAQAQVTLENQHLLTPQGNELRLHSRLSDLSGKPELLLFGVDDQGYPLPQKFPSEVRSLSIEEKKAWFLRQGTLSVTEKTWVLNTEAIHGEWKERNQKTVLLEISLSDRSVSCADSLASCRCRR